MVVVMRNAALLSLVIVACSTPVPVRFGVHQRPAPVVAISNPYLFEGDPAAGRRAFIDLQCIDCHRVAGDPTLPMGARAIAGPQLADLDRYSRKEVARRITSRQTGASEELFNRTMKDYAQPVTARQLVDLAAYLVNQKAPRG